MTAHTDFLIRFTERNSAAQDHAVIAGFRDVIRNAHERDVGFNRNAEEAKLPGKILLRRVDQSRASRLLVAIQVLIFTFSVRTPKDVSRICRACFFRIPTKRVARSWPGPSPRPAKEGGKAPVGTVVEKGPFHRRR